MFSTLANRWLTNSCISVIANIWLIAASFEEFQSCWDLIVVVSNADALVAGQVYIHQLNQSIFLLYVCSNETISQTVDLLIRMNAKLLAICAILRFEISVDFSCCSGKLVDTKLISTLFTCYVNKHNLKLQISPSFRTNLYTGRTTRCFHTTFFERKARKKMIFREYRY